MVTLKQCEFGIILTEQFDSGEKMVLRKQKMHICVVSVVEHTGRQGSYSSDGKEQHPRQFGVAGETSQ